MSVFSLTLILGGARSGKSAYAEQLARESEGSVLFLATAQALDDEMRDRIARHRAARPSAWRTLEAPVDLASALAGVTPSETVILDCVTLLVSNLLVALPEEMPFETAMQNVETGIEASMEAMQKFGGRWLVVSNEVGLGVVPAYPLGRVYRDALGRANQRLARTAERVVLMVAGIPMIVKEGAAHL